MAESELTSAVVHDTVRKQTARDFRIDIARSDIRSATVDIVAEDYPTQPALFQLKSKTLPVELIEKIETHVQQIAYKSKGQPHLAACYAIIDKMMSNKLLACFDEIKQIMDQLNTSTDTLTRKEKAGQVVVTLQERNLSCKIIANVGERYPQDKIKFAVTWTGLPEQMQTPFNRQSTEIVRRLHAGWGAGLTLIDSVEEKIIVDQQLSSVDIKHDVDFIRQKHALESMTDDKSARRFKKRFLKKETAEEMAKLEECKNTYAADTRTPHPQLFHLCAFWIQVVRRMPYETCILCNTNIIESDKRPERLNCGCWMFASCLDEFMSKPPWYKPCPKWGEVVEHKRYSNDEESIKKRERAYNNEQAKARELEDVFALFG